MSGVREGDMDCEFTWGIAVMSSFASFAVKKIEVASQARFA